MEQFTHFVLQNFVSPLLLMCFMIVVLFGVGGVDGVPIVKALLSAGAELVKVVLNLLVKLVTWFCKRVGPEILNGLACLVCQLAHRLSSRCSDRGWRSERRRF